MQAVDERNALSYSLYVARASGGRIEGATGQRAQNTDDDSRPGEALRESSLPEPGRPPGSPAQPHFLRAADHDIPTVDPAPV